MLTKSISEKQNVNILYKLEVKRLANLLYFQIYIRKLIILARNYRTKKISYTLHSITSAAEQKLSSREPKQDIFL